MMLSVLKQLRSVSFGIKSKYHFIPAYTPKKPINYESIKLPVRPPMNKDDPTQVYKIAKMPRKYDQLQTKWEKVHTIGSQYVSVAKDGKVYHLFDASRMPFGKMCQRIAYLIQGKHKPTYKYNEAIAGDMCIVINAENIRFTGKKIFQKHLTYHTGYIGHLKRIQYKHLIKDKPEQLISYGVWKQLPRNQLRMKHLEFLDIFRTREHTYTHILPQIMPRPVTFRYDSNVLEDALHPDAKVLFKMGSHPVIDEAIKGKEVENDLSHEIFTPFSLRDKEFRYHLGPKRRMVQMGQYKKLLKRYRRYYAQEPKIRDRTYDPEKFYVVTSERQIKELGLQDKDPLEEDAEIEEEFIK